jgi:hypothetical protein
MDVDGDDRRDKQPAEVIEIESGNSSSGDEQSPSNHVRSDTAVLTQVILDAADALAWWETPLNWTINEERAIEVKNIIGAQQQTTNLMDCVADNHKSHVRRGASRFASADDVSLLTSSQPSPTTTMAFAKSVLPSEASMVPAVIIGVQSLLLEKMQMEGPLVCTRRTSTLSLGLEENPDAATAAPGHPHQRQHSRVYQQYKPYLDTALSNLIHPDELIIPTNDAGLGQIGVAPASLCHDGDDKHAFDCISNQRVYGCHLLSARSFCHSQRLPNADKIFRRWSCQDDDVAGLTMKQVVDHTRYYHTKPPGDLGFVRSNFFCPEPYGLSSSGINQDPTITMRDGARHDANFHGDDFAAPNDLLDDSQTDGEPALLICRNGHVTCACCLVVHWIEQSLAQTSDLQFSNLTCPSCDSIFSVNKFWRFIYAPRTVSTMLTLINHVNGDYSPTQSSLMTSDFWPIGASTEKDDEFIYRPDVLGDQTSFHGSVLSLRAASASSDVQRHVAGNVPSGRVFSWFMWRWMPLVYRTKKEWRRYVKRPDTFMWCPNAIPQFVVPLSDNSNANDEHGWWSVPNIDELGSFVGHESSGCSHGRSIGFGICRDVADFAKMAFHLIPFTDHSRQLLLRTMLDCAEDSFASVRRWIKEIISSFTKRWTRLSSPSASSTPTGDATRLALFAAMSIASIGVGSEDASGVDERSSSTLLSNLVGKTSHWKLDQHKCPLFDLVMNMKCSVVDVAPKVKSFGLQPHVLDTFVKRRSMDLLVMTMRQVSVMNAMRRFEQACPCCGWLASPLVSSPAPGEVEAPLVRCESCLLHFRPMSNDVFLFKDDASLNDALNWSFQLASYSMAASSPNAGVDMAQVQEVAASTYRRYCLELNRHCSKNAVHFHLTPTDQSVSPSGRRRLDLMTAFDEQTTLVMDGLNTFFGRDNSSKPKSRQQQQQQQPASSSSSSIRRDGYVTSSLGVWQTDFYSRLIGYSWFSSLSSLR